MPRATLQEVKLQSDRRKEAVAAAAILAGGSEGGGGGTKERWSILGTAQITTHTGRQNEEGKKTGRVGAVAFPRRP